MSFPRYLAMYLSILLFYINQWEKKTESKRQWLYKKRYSVEAVPRDAQDHKFKQIPTLWNYCTASRMAKCSLLATKQGWWKCKLLEPRCKTVSLKVSDPFPLTLSTGPEHIRNRSVNIHQTTRTEIVLSFPIAPK